MSNPIFRRADDSSDEAFYAAPRFVTHIDAGAIATVTQLYRELLPAGGAILDLMTSWVSHLPPELRYSSVTGLGMNAAELAANPRLTTRLVQNLNTDPVLPFDTASFDGACICVSVDYLTRPVHVLREVGRVLQDNAPLVITFSNRCFGARGAGAGFPRGGWKFRIGDYFEPQSAARRSAVRGDRSRRT